MNEILDCDKDYYSDVAYDLHTYQDADNPANLVLSFFVGNKVREDQQAVGDDQDHLVVVYFLEVVETVCEWF